jgi:DNA-directed RNA polymerase specialized sigma24 family protein
MDFKTLEATYIDLIERIDQYFDDKLEKEPRARSNLESIKADLKQNLQVELWSNYNRETYAGYDPEPFIWLKAHKVWIAFTRSLKRESQYRIACEIERLPDTISAENLSELLECRDLVEQIKCVLTPKEVELLECRLNRMTYQEISDRGFFPTKEAAKSKFNRLKKFIIERFRRY